MIDEDQLEHDLLKARGRVQYYKHRNELLAAELNTLRRYAAPSRAFIARADQLADAASELPGVVKSHALRRALSYYRKARQEATP